MLMPKNFIYKTLFPRFFGRISIDEGAIEKLKNLAANSTLIYVATHIGHLEYSYYTHLFAQNGLPMAVYNDKITMRRWEPLKDLWKTIATQQTEIDTYGRPLDCVKDGFLPELVAGGSSVMINVPPSALNDEELFMTGPLRPLAQIIEAQRLSKKPITIVPLDFLWSKRPEKAAKRTMLDILFGEKDNPGFIRKTVLFWRNFRRHAQASIGREIDLKEFVEKHPEGKNSDLAVILRTRLVETFKTERRTITGPPIRPRGWFVQEVLSDDFLDRRICEISAEKKCSADDIREIAEKYVKEMAADVDFTYLELLDRFLGVTLCKLYENFDVDTNGLALAKEMYSHGPVVFVPNHKSHVDYLILSHILYNNGMTIPHIAAGINLSFWPLGKIFRSCGAYFIKREFKGNVLYKTVLETYLKILLREGYSQEFFIEGGRSRTGKLRQPKLGMISLLRSASEKAGLSGVCFIPVSLTYDRIIEEKSLTAENEGAPKETEKMLGLLKLTKYLGKKSSKQGSIYIRFGTPVHLESSLKDPVVIQKTALDICHQLNKNVVATPAAIAATAILGFSKRGVSLAQFNNAAKLVFEYLSQKGVQMSCAFGNSTTRAFNNAISQLRKGRMIATHKSALGPYLSLDESKRVGLSFFKNSIVHYLMTIGVVSKIILSSFNRGESLDHDRLVSEFGKIRIFLSHEFHFATTKAVGSHIDAAIKFLKTQGAINGPDGGTLTSSGAGLWILEQFSSHIEPYLETFYIALVHAEKMIKGDVEAKELVAGMQRTGEDLFTLGRIAHKEAINKSDLEHTLKSLETFGIIVSVSPDGARSHAKHYRRHHGTGPDKNLKVELEKLL